MPRLSESVQVPAPPEQAWRTASDLSRLGEWLSLHEDWRGDVPAELAVGTELTSVVSVKGMRNRVNWRITSYEPPASLSLKGDGVGGTKVSFELAIRPDGSGSQVSFDADFSGPMVMGPIGMTVKRALRGEIRNSVAKLAKLIG